MTELWAMYYCKDCNPTLDTMILKAVHCDRCGKVKDCHVTEPTALAYKGEATSPAVSLCVDWLVFRSLPNAD